MASLFDNIKRNATLNIDKENLEIQKKVAKKKAASFMGAFTGIHPAETKEEKEAKKRASAKRDEYREEHNKMFTGYDGSRRSGPIVSPSGSGITGAAKIKQNGKLVKAQPTQDPRHGSKMRVSGIGGCESLRAVKDKPTNAKEPTATNLRPVKGSPGILSSKPSHEYSANRFSAELDKMRNNKSKK